MNTNGKIVYLPVQDPEVEQVDKLEKIMDGLGIFITILVVTAVVSAGFRIVGQLFWGW